jgi:hypothetical protein
VLRSEKRGIQGADWFELFSREDVAQLFRTYRRNEVASELFDFDHIDALLRRWPADATAKEAMLPSYRNELLGALAIADFIELHFPN